MPQRSEALAMKRIALTLLIALIAVPAFGQATAATCDRECLRGFITQYLNALVARTPQALPTAPNVKFTEDTKTLPLGEGLWKSASKLRSYRQDFLDAREGQAATFAI